MGFLNKRSDKDDKWMEKLKDQAADLISSDKLDAGKVESEPDFEELHYSIKRNFFTIDFCTIDYTIYEFEELCDVEKILEPRPVKDFAKMCNKFATINTFSVESSERDKGHGSEAVQKFLREIGIPVLTIATLHGKEEKMLSEIDPDFLGEKQERLGRFYERNGFVYVNDFIGQGVKIKSYIHPNKNENLRVQLVALEAAHSI